MTSFQDPIDSDKLSFKRLQRILDQTNRIKSIYEYDVECNQIRRRLLPLHDVEYGFLTFFNLNFHFDAKGSTSRYLIEYLSWDSKMKMMFTICNDPVAELEFRKILFDCTMMMNSLSVNSIKVEYANKYLDEQRQRQSNYIE